MSRTDKTDPFQVKVARSKRVEIHDHRNGVCELEAEPNRLRSFPSVAYECYLDADYYEDQYRCSCFMCKGGRWSLKDRSQAKTRAKRQLRNWDKEYE